MKRTISSAAQSAFKMVVLVFAVLLCMTLLSWSLQARHVRWDLLFGPGLILALFLWFATSRKTVQIDDRFVYISTFRKTVAIPFKQIERVSERIGIKDRVVTIYFRAETVASFRLHPRCATIESRIRSFWSFRGLHTK